MGRVVDDQRLGMHPLQQVGRRDVGEVERRILPHQDDVECRERAAPRFAQRKMVALIIAYRQWAHHREHLAIDERHPIGRVVENFMSPHLGFQEQRKGRIATDIDPLDRVHLNGDI